RAQGGVAFKIGVAIVVGSNLRKAGEAADVLDRRMGAAFQVDDREMLRRQVRLCAGRARAPVRVHRALSRLCRKASRSVRKTTVRRPNFLASRRPSLIAWKIRVRPSPV